MEIKDIEAFLAVAGELNITRAAVMADVRASTLSRRVRHLEDSIGVSVFERHRSGVRLTRAGRHFFQTASRALRDLHYGIGRAKSTGAGANGLLRIGISISIAQGFSYSVIAAFIALYPDVDVEIIEGGPTGHLQSIRERQMDLALVTGSYAFADLDTAELWTEWVALALPASHRLNAQSRVEWTDVLSERFIVSHDEPGPEIHDWLTVRLAAPGRHPDVVRYAVARETLMILVSLGLGLTVISQAGTGVSYPNVVFRPLEAESDRLPFSAVWAPGNDNPVLRRFIALMRSIAEGRSIPPAP